MMPVELGACQLVGGRAKRLTITATSSGREGRDDRHTPGTLARMSRAARNRALATLAIHEVWGNVPWWWWSASACASAPSCEARHGHVQPWRLTPAGRRSTTLPSRPVDAGLPGTQTSPYLSAASSRRSWSRPRRRPRRLRLRLAVRRQVGTQRAAHGLYSWFVPGWRHALGIGSDTLACTRAPRRPLRGTHGGLGRGGGGGGCQPGNRRRRRRGLVHQRQPAGCVPLDVESYVIAAAHHVEHRHRFRRARRTPGPPALAREPCHNR